MSETRLDATREDRLAAAICHLGAFVPYVGILVTLIIWLTQKERSALLRRQALDALLFQGVATVLYMLVGGVLSGMYFVVFLPTVLLSETAAADIVPAVWVGYTVLMLGVMLLFFAAALVYYFLAGRAAWNSLRSGQASYPLIRSLKSLLRAER